MEVNRTVQENNLDILVKNGGFEFTDTFFPYTSGQIGPYFIQSAVVMKDGSDFSKACDDMSELVYSAAKDFDLEDYMISGGESRDWVFSFAVAKKLFLPHAMLYKDGRVIGDMEGKEVLHVADLNNVGSSPRDSWVPAIRNAGGEINDIFFYVDRMEEGVQVMRNLGLESHSVVPLDEHAWDYLKSKGVVDETTYRNLRERMEDKDAWAEKMLQSDEGFKELFRLQNSGGEGMVKVEKILEKGKLGIEKELHSRLLRALEIQEDAHYSNSEEGK
jgi:orotate phosphoribosyltransferase